jgi:hypothetical protein
MYVSHSCEYSLDEYLVDIELFKNICKDQRVKRVFIQKNALLYNNRNYVAFIPNILLLIIVTLMIILQLFHVRF